MRQQLWNPLRGRHDLAVDLGTANTVVYKRGEGIVVFEPSVVALDEETGRIQAIGESARRMIGRTPAHIRATRPLRHGVIADFEITEEMMAGAIGAGLPVSEPYGNLVVDIGGGTSEMAVIALGGMAVSESLRIGGYELDDAIVRHVQQVHKLLIGQQQAERVKLEVGSAWQLDDEIDRVTEVAGRDLTTGLLRRIGLNAKEIRQAIARPVFNIVDALVNMLERTPSEIAADLGERGLVLVGGGALLRGIDERIARETHLPVSIAESPLTCVALGAGQSLDEVSVLERVKRADR